MKSEDRKLVRSFGRIKSRKLSEYKQDLVDNSYPNFEISDDMVHKAKDYKFEKRSFEIGFGFGDFMVEKAKNNPNQIFFGAEPHINGVASILSKIKQVNVDNIKISTQDARALLTKFEDCFFDEFYILFPDPWPKSRHFKRRIVTREFLDLDIAQKIKKGGSLIIATDHDLYKSWICRELLMVKNFRWDCSEEKDWIDFPRDWIETKYQKKAQREGRQSVIFKLYKT